MSFILDALKKSETERQRADAPALYEMKLAPPRRGVAAWLIVLAGLLVINVVVLSVVLLHGSRGTAAPAAASDSGTPSMATVAAPTAAAAAPPVAAAPTAATVMPPAVAANPPAGAQAADSDDAPAVEPSSTVAGSGAQASTRAGVTMATGVGTGDVPTYQQVASEPGANLPELKLDLHSYATNPADRFVFLNMVNLKEGQTSPAGVRVETITPDGAILSWHGSKFFLQRQ